MGSVETTIAEILECARVILSDIKPSKWAEENRMMTTDVSPIPGMLSYKNSPYTREIVDCFSPDHPARIIAVMKGAQIGFSTTVIEAAIGWIISQCPGNILFLVGHDDLVEEAIAKVDRMIDSCGIRHLIKPNISRRKNMKTGDTNRKKEFPGGMLISGTPSNHKLLRNRSIQYGFVDDFEAAKSSTAQSGSTSEMIEQRFAAYSKKMKLAYISTPELKQTSNIYPVYLLGDQRKYNIHCPCCHKEIELNWSVKIEGNDKEMAGITWKVDNNNRLVDKSVGYICQKCAGFFNDKNKNELILNGLWIPTAIPSQVGYYSYHISSLYAPTYMYDWEHYVRKFNEANPIGETRKENLHKTFVNLCLGEPYEAAGDAPKANDLEKNIREYEIGIIPEKLSLKDGNGHIVLLTCSCDLNGIVEDARLDYEIVAWSASGSSYSITHGSIGTFIPRENTKKIKIDRERWTYEHHKQNSVWKELDKIISSIYVTDTDRKMKIFITGVDTGHYNSYAYPFVDNNNNHVISLKGKDADKYIPFGKDVSSFKRSKEKQNLYLVEVGLIKDEIASAIKLKWDSGNDEFQPPGFMNYPTPSKGKYTFNTFFSHYESEHRVIMDSKTGEGIAAKWEKKSPVHQNHFWDVRVYNIALKDILTSMACKQLDIKNGTWADYVNAVLANKK